MNISSWIAGQLETHRFKLSRPDALIQLTFLGWLTGILAGGVIVLFRLLVEVSQEFLLSGHSENYEALSIEMRFVFPIVGSVIIATGFYFYTKTPHVLGVAGVIKSMAFHQGYLSVREFLLQFFGAAVAIISGHSVGREGPNVFLGAASGSLLGQFFTLPNNTIRILVGCGTAAGIAASFDTPLAGVIFALEVVLMEYTLVTFLPIILAAGSATTLSVFVFGNEPAFIIPHINQGALIELPLVIILGLLAGILSALAIHLVQAIAQKSKMISLTRKLVLSGVLMGMIAMIIPGVMGIGYDTVSQMLAGHIALNMILVLLIFKLIATVISIGLGIPGGMIGPALFMGASLGGGFGLIMGWLFPNLYIDAAFYSLLGMGAVMGASLQAPLAALTAIMELTHSPQIIMPGMIAIVVANLTASEFFHKKSLFLSVLEAREINEYTNPITQTLRRIGVASIMDRNFISPDSLIQIHKIDELLINKPHWLLVKEDNKPLKLDQNEKRQLMPTVDLVNFLELKIQNDMDNTINLLKIPANRIDIAPIHLQATLEEALNKINELNIDALYIERMSAPGIMYCYGIVTRSQIESAYRLN
ncbi:MAG: chloride channel protein [Gammaproteobacteria bacterium]|nr:chloride channel protein [Gammaproteobacteria bacterium]